jgi:hypothetical protein
MGAKDKSIIVKKLNKDQILHFETKHSIVILSNKVGKSTMRDYILSAFPYMIFNLIDERSYPDMIEIQ